MKSPAVPGTCGGGGRTCWCDDGGVGGPAYPGKANDATGEMGGDARGCGLDAERHGYLWNPTSSTAGASVAAAERSMVYRMTARTSLSTTSCCEMVWTTVKGERHAYSVNMRITHAEEGGITSVLHTYWVRATCTGSGLSAGGERWAWTTERRRRVASLAAAGDSLARAGRPRGPRMSCLPTSWCDTLPKTTTASQTRPSRGNPRM